MTMGAEIASYQVVNQLIPLQKFKLVLYFRCQSDRSTSNGGKPFERYDFENIWSKKGGHHIYRRGRSKKQPIRIILVFLLTYIN